MYAYDLRSQSSSRLQIICLVKFIIVNELSTLRQTTELVVDIKRKEQ
jgi:hypothetical protein